MEGQEKLSDWMEKIHQTYSFLDALTASAGNVCTGGLADVLTEAAMMI